jgi:hypothetical protein
MSSTEVSTETPPPSTATLAGTAALATSTSISRPSTLQEVAKKAVHHDEDHGRNDKDPDLDGSCCQNQGTLPSRVRLLAFAPYPDMPAP